MREIDISAQIYFLNPEEGGLQTPIFSGYRPTFYQDAVGNVTATEVKSGNAIRSAVQRAKDAEIAAGGGTFVGKNAPDVLRGRQRAVETVERKPNN